MDQLPRVFLLERRNQRFLDDRARWTSQQRRSFIRLVVACTVCLCIGFVLLTNHRQTMKLLISGQKTNATIISKRTDSETENHYVKYRFSTDSVVTPIEVEKKTPVGTYDDSTVGNLVKVLYDRRNPSDCLIGQQISSSSKDRAVLFGWAAFSALLLAYMLFDFRMNSVMRSKGIILVGSLRSVQLSQHDVESPSEATVLYSFKEPLGSTVNAETKGRTSRSNVADFRTLNGNSGQPQAVAVLYFSDRKYILL